MENVAFTRISSPFPPGLVAALSALGGGWMGEVVDYRVPVSPSDFASMCEHLDEDMDDIVDLMYRHQRQLCNPWELVAASAVAKDAARRRLVAAGLLTEGGGHG